MQKICNYSLESSRCKLQTHIKILYTENVSVWFQLSSRWRSSYFLRISLCSQNTLLLIIVNVKINRNKWRKDSQERSSYKLFKNRKQKIRLVSMKQVRLVQRRSGSYIRHSTMLCLLVYVHRVQHTIGQP